MFHIKTSHNPIFIKAGWNSSFPSINFLSLNNTDSVVQLFLKAIVHHDTESAKNLMSKNCQMDLNKLTSLFHEKRYKQLAKVEYNEPKNYITSSILLFDGQQKSLMHIHLILEPNNFSKWKIAGVDTEN